MTYGVVVTGPAERDVRANYQWWAENRSKDQADRWFAGINQAIQSLKQMPHRCSFAAEKDLMEEGIRQLLYSAGRRYTHRIVFAIAEEDIVILRVRNFAQDVLGVVNLGEDD